MSKPCTKEILIRTVFYTTVAYKVHALYDFQVMSFRSWLVYTVIDNLHSGMSMCKFPWVNSINIWRHHVSVSVLRDLAPRSFPPQSRTARCSTLSIQDLAAFNNFQETPFILLTFLYHLEIFSRVFFIFVFIGKEQYIIWFVFTIQNTHTTSHWDNLQSLGRIYFKRQPKYRQAHTWRYNSNKSRD